MPTQIGKSYLSASEKSKNDPPNSSRHIGDEKITFSGGIEMEHWGYMG